MTRSAIENDVRPVDKVSSQLSRLFGRDSLYMVIWALQLLCAACLTPVITRVLGVAEFGVVASAIAVMEVLFVLGGLGLDTAVQRQFALAADALDARRLLGLTVVLAAVFTALMSGSLRWWSAPLGFGNHTTALHLAVVWAGLCAVTSAALALLRSQDRLAGFVTVGLMQSVVAEAASLFLVMGHAPTATSFLQGRVIAQLGATITALVLARPTVLTLAHMSMAASALRYALPLVPASLGSFVLTTADRLIVQGSMGNVAVARYQVAYNIAAVPLLLLSVLQSVWLPRFFAVDGGQERQTLLVDTRQMLYRLLAPGVLGFAISAPLILRIWAPPEYEPEGLTWVVSVIVVTAVPFAAQVLISLRLTTEGRTGTLAMATAAAAVSNVALNFLLIPVLGLCGSAVATLLSYGVLYAVLHMSARRLDRVSALQWRIRVQLAGAGVVAVMSAALPIVGVAVAVRVAAVAACLAWFLVPLLRLLKRGHGEA